MDETLAKEIQGNYSQVLIAIPIEEYEHLKVCEQELKVVRQCALISAKIQMENYKQLADELSGITILPNPNALNNDT